jgi:hypothetical protein
MSFGDVMESMLGVNQPTKYLGKYRGTVINNEDPMQMGRIMALVPDVSGTFPTSWAMPCLPAVGIQFGICVVPPLNAGVWIEFEQGDPDYPIWTGCFWGGPQEVPVLMRARTPASPGIVLQTVAQNIIAVTDVPPQILLKCGASSLMMRPDGITMVGTNITVNGTLLVNNGALTVTV